MTQSTQIASVLSYRFDGNYVRDEIAHISIDLRNLVPKPKTHTTRKILYC
ncbi:MAG: hypothetical protein U0Z75_08430 [Deinococcaceae bacterium]